MTLSHPAVRSACQLDALRRVDPTIRRRHLELRTWALSQGVAVDRATGDGLTVVLAVLAEAESVAELGHQAWSAARVVDFVWHDCPLWCFSQAVAIPAGTTSALRLLWDHLAATDAFDPGSDERSVLERTLVEHTGAPHGRRRR